MLYQYHHSGRHRAHPVIKFPLQPPGPGGHSESVGQVQVPVSLPSVSTMPVSRAFHADARFHGADGGDGQYQRFTLLAREQAVLTDQGVGLSISVFSLGSVTFILCSYSLCSGDQSRLSFTRTMTGRPASKQVWYQLATCRIALFYPAYSAGIRQLQTGGTVQTDHVGRFPQE